LLGYKYSFDAKVIEGDKMGRELGFPTANLEPVAENKVIPLNGVYAVYVVYKGIEYKGMMNIGYRPTVREDSERVIEVNILEFAGDIYGENLIVKFTGRVRDELKFGSKDELIEQIKIDRKNVLKILNNK
jgi:riboflavin kinase/FMN adenylyltransferase